MNELGEMAQTLGVERLFEAFVESPKAPAPAPVVKVLKKKKVAMPAEIDRKR